MKPSLHNISDVEHLEKVPSEHNGGRESKTKQTNKKEAVLEKIKIKYFLHLKKVKIDVKPRAVLT